MNPTRNQIQAEIDALKGQLDRVRPFSVFGDNNKEKIRAQINVLKHDYDEDDIDDLIDEEYQDDARDARQWLDGDSEESPSESWEPLCS